MQSKDVLKAALQDFDGTLICVSHDRDFLNGLVSKVYEFGGGRVKEHLGGIYDFLRAKKLNSLDELNRKNPLSQSTAKNGPIPTVDRRSNDSQGSLTMNHLPPNSTTLHRKPLLPRNARKRNRSLRLKMPSLNSRHNSRSWSNSSLCPKTRHRRISKNTNLSNTGLSRRCMNGRY